MAKYQYNPDAEKWPFLARSLLTDSEKIFHATLKDALPEYVIYVQVPLSQMLRVERGHDEHAWNNRINRMSVDFVVSDEFTRIIAAIELDDPSHDNPKRQADDAKKDKALQSAGIRVLRWRVECMPDRELVRATVLDGPSQEIEKSDTTAILKPLELLLMRGKPPSFLEKYGRWVAVLTFVAFIGVLTLLPKGESEQPQIDLTSKVAPAFEGVSLPMDRTSRAVLPATSQTIPPPLTVQASTGGDDVSLRSVERMDSESLAEQECQSWKNSNILEPTAEKRRKIAELCVQVE